MNENNIENDNEDKIMNMFKIKGKYNKKKDINNNKDADNNNDDDDDYNESDDDNDEGGFFRTNNKSIKSISDEESDNNQNTDSDKFETHNINTVDDFINPSEQLDDLMNNKIEIKSQARGRKTTTIIIGLNLNKDKEKSFLTMIKKKMAMSGSKKKVLKEELEGGSYHKDKSKRGQPKMKDIPKVEVYLFTGECKDEVKNILINYFDISEDSIIC